MLKIRKTSDLSEQGTHKVLLYTHHGFGKTYQIRNYQRRFGRGLIVSGEAGLKSIEDVDIDYAAFDSWDGPDNPDSETASFRSIMAVIGQPGFLKENGYNWIAIDSLTELSERLLEHLEEKHKGAKSPFPMWGEYSALMLGALKWTRDLPVHVYVTCLAKEEKDAEEVTQFWPLVKGSGVSKHVPAIFDHVLCGVRVTDKTDPAAPVVRRYFITDETRGWHGKVRDPRNRLKPVERCDDITILLDRMSMPDTAGPGQSGKQTKKETA